MAENDTEASRDAADPPAAEKPRVVLIALVAGVTAATVLAVLLASAFLLSVWAEEGWPPDRAAVAQFGLRLHSFRAHGPVPGSWTENLVSAACLYYDFAHATGTSRPAPPMERWQSG